MTEPTAQTETPTSKPKLTKMAVAHGAVRFAASTSVKLIIGTAIAQVVPTETKVQKAKVIVGTYVLSGIVSDAAKNWASSELDDTLEFASTIISTVKGAKSTSEPQPETDPTHQ